MITTVKEKLYYGLGDLGGNILWAFTGTFLMQYLTDYIKLSAAFLGTMMLICRLFDGTSDILMGRIIEQTHSKKGKGRFWYGITIIPLGIFLLMLFNVSKIPQSYIMIYLTAVFFIFSVILATANNLGYHTILSRISDSQLDQSKISALRTILAGIGVGSVVLFVPVLLPFLGGVQSQKAWSILAITYFTIAMITMSICYFKIKEKIPVINLSDVKKSFFKEQTKKGLKELLKTKYFYISILICVFTFLSSNLSVAMGVYYSKDVLGSGEYFSLFALVSFPSMLLGVILSPSLVKRIGKKNTLVIAGIVSFIGGVVPIFQPESLMIVLAGLLIKGFGIAIISCLMFTLPPDIIAYIELKAGVRIEGYATSASSFGIKLGVGLSMGIVGWALSWGGYNPDLPVQPDSVIQAQIAVQWLLPAIISIILIVLFLLWNIGDKILKLRDYKITHC